MGHRNSVTVQIESGPDRGKWVNRNTSPGAPQAKSPRLFDTVGEAVAAAEKASKRAGIRSQSALGGTHHKKSKRIR